MVPIQNGGKSLTDFTEKMSQIKKRSVMSWRGSVSAVILKRLVAGSKRLVAGSERSVAGSERSVAGSERSVAGSERSVAGSERLEPSYL